MKWLLLVSVLGLLSACDSVVETEAVGAPFKEVRTLSGTEWGYCYNYIRGKFDYNGLCNCHYDAEVQVQNVQYVRKSGKVDYSQKVDVTRHLTECD